jgi:hypothetical protein
MELIARLIYIKSVILGAFLITAGLIILANGGSAMKPILSGLGVINIGFIISEYIESIKFKKK